MTRRVPFFLSLLTLLGMFFIVAPTFAVDGAPVMTRIQERGKLILGTSGNMPPMSQKLDSGDVVGLDIDMGQVMANAMGVDLEKKVIAFDQLIPALETGEVDVVISNMTINPRRNMRVAFIGPYMESGKCLVTREASLAKAAEAKAIDQENSRLVVMKNTTSEDFARTVMKNVEIVAVTDRTRAIQMVANGEARALLSDYPVCISTIKSNPDAGFVTVFSKLTYEPIGIAVPATDPLFINWTSNALVRMEKTGVLEALSEKWLGTGEVTIVPAE
jgi:polar amino acid transport system substrate-binding protein